MSGGGGGVPTHAGNPNGSVTATKGSLCVDTTNAKLYQNTDGATAWTRVGQPTGSLMGDGSDGALDFDGSSTVLGIVPSGSVYTLPRHIYPTTMRVRTGVTIKGHGWGIFASGLITMDSDTAHLSWDGAAGSGSAAGGQISFTGGYFYGAQSGGNGGASGYGAPSNGGNINPAPFGFAGAGGAGGLSGFGGGGGAGGTGGTITNNGANAGTPHWLQQAISATAMSGATSLWQGASGGGGGRGGNTAAGGGGGGGGAWGVVTCAGFRTTGSNSVLGWISADGGAGGTAPSSSDGGGGGGGGGGHITVVSADGTFPTIVTSNGGAGGLGGTTPNMGGGAHGNGATGSPGSNGQVHQFSVIG